VTTPSSKSPAQVLPSAKKEGTTSMTRTTTRPKPPRSKGSTLLSVDAMLERLSDENGPLARRTWQQWRATGKGPKCHKLPNGRVVCREAEFERWLDDLVDHPDVTA
jgi:hypothetical protein